MSSVYLALQESLGRSVAVKVLDRIGSPQHASRFLHEARIIASLQHHNIITIHDVGTVADRHYIAMEYLEGGSLADRIDEGMSPKQALDLLENIAACLDFVHRRGIVHGDIKPGNILFHSDGTPKLSDFGIAERGGDQRPACADGKIFGSPHYFSPEQTEGLRRDGRSDIYGLGIVFHQMLTGQLPYVADSDVEVIVAHLSSPIPLLPEALSGGQRLLEKMIAKRPADRVSDAAELLQLIRETRARMTRRGRLIDAFSGLLPATTALEHPIWPAAVRMPSAGRIGAVAGILLVMALGLAGLSDKAVPDRTAAAEAVDAAPKAGEGPTPTPAAHAEKSAAANSAPGLAPPAEFVSNSPADSDTLMPSSPEPAKPLPAPRAESASQAQLDSAAAPVVDLPAPVPDEARVDGWIQAAEQDLAANRLTTPANDNAYDRYRQVLDLVPDHARARAGLNQIAERYAAMGQRALAANKTALARVYLRRGIAVRGDNPALLRLRDELEADERRLAHVRPPADPPDAADAAPLSGPDTAFDFEDVGARSRGQQGSGNMIEDFKHVWRSMFD